MTESDLIGSWSEGCNRPDRDGERRILRSAAVRKYMEGSSRHPGFLLPWEDLREDPDGYYFFVDLVTGETTFREEKLAGARKSKLYDRAAVMGLPPLLYFAPIEEKTLFLRRRAFYVDYWRFYLERRGDLLG